MQIIYWCTKTNTMVTLDEPTSRYEAAREKVKNLIASRASMFAQILDASGLVLKNFAPLGTDADGRASTEMAEL